MSGLSGADPRRQSLLRTLRCGRGAGRASQETGSGDRSSSGSRPIGAERSRVNRELAKGRDLLIEILRRWYLMSGVVTGLLFLALVRDGRRALSRPGTELALGAVALRGHLDFVVDRPECSSSMTSCASRAAALGHRLRRAHHGADRAHPARGARHRRVDPAVLEHALWTLAFWGLAIGAARLQKLLKTYPELRASQPDPRHSREIQATGRCQFAFPRSPSRGQTRFAAPDRNHRSAAWWYWVVGSGTP